LIGEGDKGIRRERKRRRSESFAQKELFKFLGCKSTFLQDFDFFKGCSICI